MESIIYRRIFDYRTWWGHFLVAIGWTSCASEGQLGGDITTACRLWQRQTAYYKGSFCHAYDFNSCHNMIIMTTYIQQSDFLEPRDISEALARLVDFVEDALRQQEAHYYESSGPCGQCIRWNVVLT